MSRLAGAAVGLVGALALSRALRRRRHPLAGTALVTGGTRGLGLCLAEELLRRGLKVVVCARSQPELESVARSLPGEVYALQCDVRDPEALEDLVARAEELAGPVDVLVNNAGIISMGPVEDMDVEDFQKAMDTMFWPLVHTTRRILPGMLARKRGWILNVTSIGGRFGVPHLVPYACAKSAAIAFSEGLRAEVRPKGISVLTAVPGLMRTGSYLNARFKGKADVESAWFRVASSNPLVTVDARVAARQLLRGLESDVAQRTLTLPAKLAARMHGMFPALFNDLVGYAAHVALPGPVGYDGPPLRDLDLEADQPRWLHWLTAPGRQSARKYQAHHPEIAERLGTG